MNSELNLLFIYLIMSNTAFATLKYALTSDKKLSLMAKLVRWKKAQESLDALQFIPKRTAKIFYKVIKSAIGNATNAWLKLEDLYIKSIEVWRWPKIKRIRFVSRSRVNYIIKHRAFVKVILSNNIG